jgi:hypothetical protein
MPQEWKGPGVVTSFPLLAYRIGANCSWDSNKVRPQLCSNKSELTRPKAADHRRQSGPSQRFWFARLLFSNTERSPHFLEVRAGLMRLDQLRSEGILTAA